MSNTDLMNVTAINSAHLKYNQLLVASLAVPICEEFRKMRGHAIEESKSDPKGMLTLLRSYLRETKSWNQDIIDRQCVSVKSYCQKRLRGRISLARLIETSLVSTAKIMGTPRIGKPKGQIELDVPEPSEFVKDAFVRCSSELHSRDNIVLCTNKATRQEQARNEKNIRKLVKNCVEEFILTSIPLEEILDNVEDEADMVEEAKQILEDAKEEVRLGHGRTDGEVEGETGTEVEGEVEGGGGKEMESGDVVEGMPPMDDNAPAPGGELHEGASEIKTLSVHHTPEDDEDGEKDLIEKERKGFYNENDHGFFSDSDLDSNEDNESEEEGFSVDEDED